MPIKVPPCGNLDYSDGYYCRQWPLCRAGHELYTEDRPSGKKVILCHSGNPGCIDYKEGEILTLEELRERK
ncbi:MAG: hypothetical protein PHU23_18575 [Dehalococcoidales bacterium]|nr:hypothetical protein [Dehalococcoidales bacterium]